MEQNVKEKNFVSAVIYIRSGEEDTDKNIENLLKVMKEHFEHYEIIFVNDASSDGCVDKIKKIFAKEENNGIAVRIINMSYYYGREIAMSAGVDMAIGDYVFEFDRISSIGDDIIMKAYYKCIQGTDIVSVTPKKVAGFITKMYYKIYNSSSNIKENFLKRELFCVVSRRTINRVKAMAKNIPYRKAMYAQCGLPIETITYEEEEERREKYTRREKEVRYRLASDSLILFTNVVSKITTMLCVLFLLFSLGVGIYVCVIYFGKIKPVEGWSPIMGFLSATFCGIFFVLSIIIKYLTMILQMVFLKEQYMVESVEKI